VVAIQLCRMIGAEIYATCGNEEKVQHLINKCGIPRDRIFNSRDDSFLAGVMRETGGRRVDIVLNSLSGELLHVSWKCVAEFGKLVELGKRDLVGCGKLDMQPFPWCCEYVTWPFGIQQKFTDSTRTLQFSTLPTKSGPEQLSRKSTAHGILLNECVLLVTILASERSYIYIRRLSQQAPGRTTTNLHHAFMNQSLDFCVMTSSLVTLIDQPDQGNYAAANTFLESFVQYRHKLGLPASVLGICPVDDIGFVAENPAIRKKLKSQGFYFLPERELLDYMELAVSNSHRPVSESSSSVNDPTASWKSTGHVTMGLRSEVHLEDPNCQASWRRDRCMGMYHNVPNDATGESSALNFNSLKSFLSRAADDPDILDDKSSTDFLAQEIGVRIFRFTMKPEEDIRFGDDFESDRYG
jgi:KR domain/Zinc-binding dehydrogenase